MRSLPSLKRLIGAAVSRLCPSFGIGARLALGLGTLILLLVLVATFGWYGLRDGARTNAAAQGEMALAMSLTQTAAGLQAMRRYEKDVFLSLGQPELIGGYRKSWEEGRDITAAALARARSLARSDEDGAQLRRLKPSMAAYEAGFIEVLGAHQRGTLASGSQAREQMTLLQSSADLVEAQALELSRSAARRVENAQRELEGSARKAMLILLALSGLAVALGAIVGWLIARSVTRPIAIAGRLVQSTAQGDLTARPARHASGEIGRLIGDIVAMNLSLGELVEEVRRRAQAVDEGAGRIQEGNHELAQRTESQATALEETAAAAGAFSTAIRENAEAAASADASATEAAEMARRAGSVTDALLERFRAIEESSRRITEITSLVETIAFQTNVLALNAAIEAARAGEAGRGFAVVASEVRRLSQGTTEAAQAIAKLVEEAVLNVSEGGRLVGETGEVIDGVAVKIEALNRSVSDIAVATREQRTSVEQIGHALSQLDSNTQDNARLADQSSLAASELQHVAADLIRAVARSRVDESQGAKTDGAATETREASGLRPPGGGYLSLAATK